ncbi:hypothetical protein C809_00436 [Lachnospiraceae bacterium MD335]|jgi:hypothetical protein|nr:hypothetical protein C809_00436 [Lachnospiraceae bacterium MD335]
MLLKKKYKKNIKKDVKNTAKAVRKIDYALGAVLDILTKPVEKDMEDDA